MSVIYFVDDPFSEAETWDKIEAEDVLGAISDHHRVWPTTGRVYHESISDETDVTPKCKEDIDHLKTLEGNFFVVVLPEGPVAIIVAVVAAVAIAATILLIQPPDVPTNVAVATTRTATRAQSPNNELNRRTNQPRPNARIPDIYGQVRSTPDLISQPYRYYVDHQQVETSYLCIGRGEYDISDIRDGETRIQDVPGTSVEIYGPNTSPDSGDEPQIRIGDPINEGVKTVFESNAVNGQLMRAPNAAQVDGLNVTLEQPNILRTTSSSPDVSFLDVFEPGDSFELENFTATIPTTGSTSFDGIYRIANVTATQLILDDPKISNPAWEDENFVDPLSDTANLIGVTEFWVGPYLVKGGPESAPLVNIVARQGLYRQGNNQSKKNVNVIVEATPINSAGDPVSLPITRTATVVGSATVKSARAVTVRFDPTGHSGDWSVRVRRTTNNTNNFNGTVVEDIQWESLFTLSSPQKTDFGNVTTAHTITTATRAALRLKERKLNMLATRKIPTRQTNGSFGPPVATKNAADILMAIATDPFIGRLTSASVDVDNVYSTLDEIEEYFGNTKLIEFNYTFDRINTTYEQSVTAVASALFCTAYRQGQKLLLSFEKRTDDNVLLFNHRNKAPNTETRTFTFGNVEQRDGIEVEYVDPDTDTSEIFYVPEDQSATNPKKVSVAGLRNVEQARIHAYRAYNKLRYQVVTAEFDAVGEAKLLVTMDKVLNADNTRQEVQDGEITAQEGLVLTLSQPVDFQGNTAATLHVQLANRTTETFTVMPVASNSLKVTLDRVPSQVLVLQKSRYTKSTYAFVVDEGYLVEPFLIQRATPGRSAEITKVVAVNYDARYYANDNDVAQSGS